MSKRPRIESISKSAGTHPPARSESSTGRDSPATVDSPSSQESQGSSLYVSDSATSSLDLGRNNSPDSKSVCVCVCVHMHI